MTRNIKEFVNHGVSIRPKGAEIDAFGADHVCILLALYNGAANLGAQLNSLAAQSHDNWSLVVSDDGSSDQWFDIVSRFAANQAPGKTWVLKGPGQGFARNFLNLLRHAGPLVPFAAFCDQDDVWMRHKLARAIAHLRSVPDHVPALYCGRTVICDQDLRPLRASLPARRPPGFANALVQNIGGGNTMVLNRAALDILQDTADHASGVIAHDWWVYQVISGAGGTVFFDQKPSVYYRQHPQNQIGANDSLMASLKRLSQVMAGRFRDWNTANIAALQKSAHWLTPEAEETLDRFCRARGGSLATRLQALWQSGVRRQRRRGTIALWLAAVADLL